MSLKNIIITGSIGSIATQSYGQRTYISSTEEQSFPIEHITGSDAKAWPNFVQGTNYTVDLVVNVTQSWSGSNITPLGITPYVHNTMEEFVNGEFSGSSYVVTDGNLNDEQCEQFLTVNTTPTNYSLFFLYANSVKANSNVYNSDLNVFLSPYTVPRNGEAYIFTLGKQVQYLKVARIDQEGNDNTLSLQELLKFSWTDSNYGKLTLDIKNITEYPSYYLYTITQNFPTVLSGSIADGNYLNYTFSASVGSPGYALPASTQYIYGFSVNTNASGIFDNTYYRFANTPNTKILYTASVEIYNGDAIVNAQFDFNFVSYDGYSYNTIDTVSANFPKGTQTFTLMGESYTVGGVNKGFIGGSNVIYFLEIKDPNIATTLNLAEWSFTQSQAPQSATSSVVIEPYLSSIFTNSDCDVLMNNYSENDISTTYQKVLYANDGTIPSNLEQIISGTAEYAQVNDYLFNANANILPRYKGVRTTSRGFNLPSTNGLSNEILSGIDPSTFNINSGIPNVQTLNTLTAYCDYIEESTPIINNSSYAHIKYLIDENGQVRIPNITENSLADTQDTFISNENIKIYASTQNAGQVTNLKSIIRGGQRPEVILYNQNGYGTNIGWTSSITLSDNNTISGLVNNYQIRQGFTSNFNCTQANNWEDINMNILYTSGSSVSLGTNNRYQITQALKSDLTQIQVLFWPLLNRNSGLGGTVYFRLYNYTTNKEILDIGGMTPGYTWSGNQSSNYNPVRFLCYWLVSISNLQVGDELGLQMIVGQTEITLKQSNTTGNSGLGDSVLKINQFPAPNVNVSTVGLWQSGSNLYSLYNSNILFTTNSLLTNNFGAPTLFQEQIPNSGFNTSSTNWNIQTGDQFRFEGREDLVFNVERAYVTSSIPPTNEPGVFIHFNTPLPSGSVDFNKFIIRRYVDDASSIIFAGTAPFNSSAPYIVQPQYTTDLLNKNIDKYVVDLTSKGIITP